MEKRVIGIGIVMLLILGACGGTTVKKSEESVVKQNSPEKKNEIKQPETTQPETQEQNLSVAYEKDESKGVLIETLSNGTKHVWVNTSDDGKCKISRESNRNGTVYEDGVAHCKKLSEKRYADIASWHMPSPEEASFLMNHAKSYLIFPSSNPNCAIMATSKENTFVYTTSSWNSAEKVGQPFDSLQRNKKTSGIRCIADE